jgi:hypothetical protein
MSELEREELDAAQGRAAADVARVGELLQAEPLGTEGRPKSVPPPADLKRELEAVTQRLALDALRARSLKGRVPRGLARYGDVRQVRNDVLKVFYLIGGPEAMAAWARQNPDIFYTVVLPRMAMVGQHIPGFVDPASGAGQSPRQYQIELTNG